jgi:hypothetical protein
MSLEAQFERLQIFSKHQKQKKQRRKQERGGRGQMIFRLKFFEEKTLNLFSFKRHIFVNISLF